MNRIYSFKKKLFCKLMIIKKRKPKSFRTFKIYKLNERNSEYISWAMWKPNWHQILGDNLLRTLNK